MKMYSSRFLRNVVFATLLGSSFFVKAQQVPCGTTPLMDKLYRDHPEYKIDADNLEDQLRQIAEDAQNQRAAGAPYTIPCVVHIIHTGQALGATSAALSNSTPNPTDAQIRAAFDAVNADYNKRNNTTRYSGNDSTGIKICLATKDPNGVSMPGGAINRFNGALTTTWTAVGLPSSNAATYNASGVYNSSAGIPEADLSTLVKWPINKYYNIYIVTEIDGNNGGSGIQGFAYYPPSGLTSPDRAIMIPWSFDASDVSTFDHEMGHALNLRHTFRGAGGTEDPNGTGACPTESSCSGDGDFICDIPLHKSMLTTACKTDNTSNACQAGSTYAQFQYNYMNYGGCPNGFSPGQTTRMRAVLAANTIRMNQVSPSNLTACGCDGTNPPYADFAAATTTPCIGVGVQINDMTSYAPTSWAWSFSPTTVTYTGGTSASSQNPIVIFNGAGPYTVTLTATNAYGSNTATKTAYITPVSGASVPFVEGFEAVTFPPTGWTRTGDDVADATAWDTDPGVKQWERKATAGNGTSTASAAVNHFAYGYNKGSKDNLISKPVSLSGLTSPILTFKVAHQYFPNTINYDTLSVYISTDCGTTYGTYVYRKFGTTLATSGSNGSSSFVPSTTANWRTETINLTSYVGGNVIVKFETRNGYGNNVFIDDINISDAPVASVTIAQTTGTNPMCSGASATFTATPVNGGTAPVYQWKVNGANVGTNSPTFTTATLTNGQIVTCVMTSNLSGVAGSPATSNAITMTVNATPATPTSASSNTPVCVGSDINLSTPTVSNVTYSWTGPSSYTSSSQNPVLSPATTAMAGTYSVTVTSTAGCISLARTTTVAVTTPAVATFSYTGTPYCKTAANPSPTFSGGGVAGTFSSTTGLVFVSTSTGQINLASSTAGTYTVTNTIAASGGCAAVTSTSTVIITAPAVATFSYTGTPYCKTAANPSPTFSGGGVAGTFSSTTGLVFVSTSTGQINLASSTAGTYTVTNTVAASGGCAAVTATSTVTITTPAVATFSYTGTPYCKTAANPSPTFSGGGVAGTFSSTTGLVFVSTSTGQINLASSTAGTYTVTNTIAASGGCAAVTSTSTVTITAPAVATFSYTGTPYCKTAANPSPTFSGGGVAGTFSSTTGLVFVSTSTGQINLASSTAGTYTVTNTVAASGGCAAVTATSTVTITTPAVATFSYTGTPYCKTAANPSPTFSGGGVAGTFSSTTGLVFVSTSTGQINLASSTAGTYTVTNTIAAAGGCAAVTATSTVTIAAPAVATFSYTGTPYCKTAANPSPTFSGGGVAGTFSSTTGLVFVSISTGQIDLANSTAGTYTVTNTIAASGGCAAVTATSTVTITNPAVATFSYTGTPYCKTASNPSPTFSGGGVAGTFSSTTGLVFVSTSTGQINLASSTAGTYTVTNTIAASGGCAAITATSTIVINAIPTVNVPSNTAVCNGANVAATSFSSSPAGGTYTWTNSNTAIGLAANGTGNIAGFTAVNSTTSPITATITVTAAVNGCNSAPTSYIITVNPQPTSTFTQSANQCLNGNSFNFTNTGSTGTYSWTFAGGTPGTSTSNNPTGITFGSAGTHTITHMVTGAGGCNTTTTSTITVYPGPTAQAVTTTSTACGSTTGTITIGATTGGISPYTYSVNGSGFTGTTNYTGMAAGTYAVIVSDANACTFTVSAIVSNSSGPTAQSVSTANETCGNSNGSITLGNTTGGTGPYLYSVNGSAYATSNTYTGLAAGTYSINVKDANGCIFSTSVVVNNSASPTGASISTGNSTCEGTNGTITIGTVTGGAPPYTYSLNGSGFTSTTSYNGFAAGVYAVIVKDNNGCTYTSNATVGNTGTIPATPTISQTGLILTSSSATGNQWYLNGSVIPGATGQNYTITSNGDYTVIVTISGCSSSVSSVYIVTGVGVDQIVNSVSLSIYPNPNDGHFTISFMSVERESYRIEIINSLGQVVYQNEITGFNGAYKKEMSVVEYGQGIYTISLISSKYETVKKMVVY
jgi:PKD repeat protein